ncbi:MAG: ATP-dependent DNA helicase PcrA [Candidatus Epulonipiscioides saccharophilum]|nr:MAG: ATP-dependent DNA helicase PcrA [Epulopiscium sp. AS2M-Bin001]
MNLNPMQQIAVEHVNGPLLILAGAGSGKTKVLTNRIEYLVNTCGVKPWEILAITFTNKAALEMKERVAALLGDQIVKDMWISTFHSMCVRILRRHGDKIGYLKSFSIYDSSDQKSLLNSILKDLNINEKNYRLNSVLANISNKKNRFILPKQALKDSMGDFHEHNIAKIYDVYQDRLYENNSMDFDDLLVNVCILLRNHPDILEYYQNKFKYILCDEYQDTNGVQYELIKQLSSSHKNLCVVGDDDQSIYGWRGADINNILDFENDFENTKVIKLEQNYRSTKNILRAANTVIENNKNRKSKTLFTENERGSLIEIHIADNEYKEAEIIAGQIEKDINAHKQDYRDFAVLYRTNAQSRAIEEKLMQYSIPYRMLGGVRFYERREIKDLIAYLKVIANDRDDIAIRRIINVPKRGIGETSIEKIQKIALENDLNFYDVAKDIYYYNILSKAPTEKIISFMKLIHTFKEIAEKESVVSLLRLVIKQINYMDFLKESSIEDAEDRIANVSELVSKAAIYSQSAENPSLDGFLEEIALVSDVDNYDQNSNSVVLMTLHSAKGLEFPVVFLPGWEEGLFPSYMSISAEDKSLLEEERRLAYVGITRAREKLYLLQAESRMTYGSKKIAVASRFLRELPKDVLEFKNMPFRKKYSESINQGSAYRYSNNYPKNMSVKQSDPVKSYSKPKTSDEFNSYSKPKISDEFNSYSKPKASDEFSIGDRVSHRTFGKGKVIGVFNIEGKLFVTICFDSGDLKKVNAKLAKLTKLTKEDTI